MLQIEMEGYRELGGIEGGWPILPVRKLTHGILGTLSSAFQTRELVVSTLIEARTSFWYRLWGFFVVVFLLVFFNLCLSVVCFSSTMIFLNSKGGKAWKCPRMNGTHKVLYILLMFFLLQADDRKKTCLSRKNGEMRRNLNLIGVEPESTLNSTPDPL